MRMWRKENYLRANYFKFKRIVVVYHTYTLLTCTRHCTERSKMKRLLHHLDRRPPGLGKILGTWRRSLQAVALKLLVNFLNCTGLTNPL